MEGINLKTLVLSLVVLGLLFLPFYDVSAVDMENQSSPPQNTPVIVCSAAFVVGIVVIAFDLVPQSVKILEHPQWPALVAMTVAGACGVAFLVFPPASDGGEGII